MRRLLTVLFLGIAGSLAHGTETNNYVLRALPKPHSAGPGQAGEVVIDGKLDDWDLSGGILMCHDTARLLGTNSVRAYLMYDAGALYAAFQFRDRTPMVNHVDPKLEPSRGWRSDCVQFRFWTDHDKPVGPGGSYITHIDCYYFTDGKRPAVQILHHDMSKRAAGLESSEMTALGRGVDAAFLRDADGKGYVQEMRIEWEKIRRSGEPYLAGESFRLGLECFWGDGSGYKWYKQRLVDLINQENPRRQFFWTSHPSWGEVKLVKNGNVEPSPSIMHLTHLKEQLAKRYATAGPVRFEYSIPADGYVTFVVEKPDGTRVRNLVGEHPRKVGRLSDFWDGTDDAGNLAEIGEYTVRGLWRPELDVLYQFAYGCPGDPVWDTPDGTGAWMSDYRPCGVATDGTTQFVTGAYFDCGVGTIALNQKGRKLWGLRPPSTVREPAIAVDQTYVYLACGREPYLGYTKGLKKQPEDTLLLSRLDKKTGKPVPFEGERRSFVELGKVPGLTGLPYESYGQMVEEGAFSAEVALARVKGLASGRGALYISSYFEDEILVADQTTGKLTGRIQLPRPAGLVYAADGNLLAVSAGDRQVVRVDPVSGQATTIVAAGLEAPVGLALDASGNIYVSDWGRAMCVKVFSPTGQFLRTVGKPGGRPWIGAYDRDGMLLPHGITIDDQGRLWVVEWDSLPCRISVWDAAEGSFRREFISAHSYAGANCWIFPDTPERAFAQGAEFELDWTNGRYRTLGTLWRPTRRNSWFGPYPDCHRQRQIVLKGRKLLVSLIANGVTVVSERQGDRYQPLAAIGNVGAFVSNVLNVHGQSFTGQRFLTMPQIFADHLYWPEKLNKHIQEHYPEFFDGTFCRSIAGIHPNILEIFRESGAEQAFKQGYIYRGPTTNFTWADRNGDGLVQAQEELSFFETPGIEPKGLSPGWTAGVAPDGTIYTAATDRTYKACRFPVSGWTECGAPVYDPAKARLIIDETMAEHGYSNSQWVDGKGNLLSNSTGGLKMYSAAGKKLWTYPNEYAGVHASHKAPKSEQGMLVGPLYVVGSVDVEGLGEVFAFNSNYGQAYLMTTDGLFVGTVFQDVRAAPDDMPAKAVRGESHRNTTMDAEWFGGQFFRNPRDGKPHLVGEHHCAGGNCIYKLTGLDQAQRIPPVSVVFDKDAYAAAERAKFARAASSRPAGPAAAAKDLPAMVVHRLAAPAVIDGVGNEYARDPAGRAMFAHDEAHSAVAIAAYDDSNLYLFVQVRDDSPLRNLAKFGRNELFKSGDCVLFELGTARAADDAGKAPGEGDIRLLLANSEGENTALLYRYVAPEATAWIEITSGLGTLRIAEVKPLLPDARVATTQTDGAYTLEAAVPLAALGFSPQPGHSYRGDIGVVYSNKDGTKNTLRMHWATRDTGLTSDAYTEAQIRPDQWGIIKVEQ